MKSHKNSLKQSTIQVRNTLVLQDIEAEKKKKSQNIKLIKKEPSKNEREDKILRNAYKNVIDVISNLLENINDEKKDGKLKVIGTHRIIESKNKNKIKKSPLKKLVSYDKPTLRYTLNSQGTKSDNNFASNMLKNNNTVKASKSPLKLSLNWKSSKQQTDNYNTEGSGSELNSSIMNSSRSKNNNSIQKIYKKFPSTNPNLFFKPKNKLMSRWNSLKTNKKSLEPNSKNNLNNLNNSSLSSNSLMSNSKNSIAPKPKSDTNYSFNRLKINNPLNRTNLNISENLKDKESKSSDPNSPFSSIQTKIKDTEVDEDVSKNILDINNSENNDETSINNEELLNSKRKKKIKKMITKNSLKPMKINSIKSFHKEKRYRCLLSKGFVYDSLDDEEESDEEDINKCYISPNNKFLYFFDSLILISSLIILFYLPVYLSHKLFFCQNLSNKNTIIFYFIDFIYIIDLFLNFYRSYYNFEEVLVKKNILIFINYLKTWLFFDLISSFPVYTLLNTFESKCIEDSYYNDNNLNNNGNHSHYYNVNLNKIHYILLLIKVIKTLKVFKKNIALNKIRIFFYERDFLNKWGNVLLYALSFFCFLNFTASIFIFLGRNIINSWIFLHGLEEKSFIDIYVAAIYYLVMTVTTVGYGDVLGKTIKEIFFQIIMIIAGTCIYSWLISSISTYVKKMNEKNVKYQEKLKILEEIKLNNHLNEKLYNKILRLLNYRKYREEETEKNIILESLPNSLKNSLIIEMYKNYINGFSFFRSVENREFIVQIISKLNPILGMKGDILIQEGEFIEEIIFIKNGVLSLEVWLDMSNPEESIQNYLIENGFIDLKNERLSKSSSRISKGSIYSTLSIINKRNSNLNTTFNHYFEKIDNKNEKAINENKKKLKVLNIRKNEHFGDVPMFLNKRSPFYIRVNSRKADLLFLKKLDAMNISDKYPDIWKLVIKRPLENSKIISNLALKTLSTFCNINGIKTKLFRQRNKIKIFPRYYLTPIINRSLKSFKKKKNKIKKNYKKEKSINIKLNKTEDYSKKLIQELNPEKNIINRKKKFSKTSFYEGSSFSFNNCNNNRLENKQRRKSTFLNEKNKNSCYKILVTNSEDKNNSNKFNSKENSNKNNSKFASDNSNLNFKVNKEILSDESFNIQLYEDEKPKSTVINNNFQKMIPDNIYINHLNINYLGMPLPIHQQNENLLKKENKSFENLEISSKSTLEINSSYENINEITSYKYISDLDLRKQTKNFLVEKCKMKSPISPIFISSGNILKIRPITNKLTNKKQNSRIYKSSISKNLLILSKKTFEKKEANIIKKTRTNKINNNMATLSALNNFQKIINKSDKYNNNIRIMKTKSYKSFDLNLIKYNKDLENYLKDEKNGSQIYLNNYRKKRLFRRSLENSPIKKRKKTNELDIITSNIQRTAQNLNQPDLFYAGLFNNLIIKDYPKLKESHI